MTTLFLVGLEDELNAQALEMCSAASKIVGRIPVRNIFFGLEDTFSKDILVNVLSSHILYSNRRGSSCK